jgi:hypothetical protein
MPDRWWIPSDETLARVAPGTEVKVLAVRPDEDGNADLWDGTAIWLKIDARDEHEVEGSITNSNLDCDGHREGDRLRVGLDRIFDVVFVGDDGRPSFNAERARFAVGKRVLIGLTKLSASGEAVQRRQFLGTVARVDPVSGIELALADGSTYWATTRRTVPGGGAAWRVPPAVDRRTGRRPRLHLHVDRAIEGDDEVTTRAIFTTAASSR